MSVSDSPALIEKKNSLKNSFCICKQTRDRLEVKFLGKAPSDDFQEGPGALNWSQFFVRMSHTKLRFYAQPTCSLSSLFLSWYLEQLVINNPW